MQYLFIAAYLCLSAGGLVLFKLGSNASGVTFSIANGNLILSANLLSIAGLCCYLCSFLMYMIIVSKYDLTRIYPITSGLIYTLVFAGGILLLKEQITTLKIVGSCVILVGIILINL